MEHIPEPPGAEAPDLEQPAPPTQQPAPPRRLIRILVVVAVLSTGIAGFAWSRGNTSDVPEVVAIPDLILSGSRPVNIAPDFRVGTLDGGTFSLSDHLASDGSPVLLNLWASWCPPCRAEMPALDAAAIRHPDVKFVGVAVQDDYQAAERFASEIGVSYTIGLDEKGEVNALYPSAGLPVTFLIAADGNVVQALYGQLDEAQIESSLAMWFGG